MQIQVSKRGGKTSIWLVGCRAEKKEKISWLRHQSVARRKWEKERNADWKIRKEEEPRGRPFRKKVAE